MRKEASLETVTITGSTEEMMQLYIDIPGVIKETINISVNNEDVKEQIDLFCKERNLNKATNFYILNQFIKQLNSQITNESILYNNIRIANDQFLQTIKEDEEEKFGTTTFNTNKTWYNEPLTNKSHEPNCFNENFNQSDKLNKKNSLLPLFNSKKGSLVYKLEQELLNRISLNNSNTNGNNEFPEIPREIVLKIKLLKYKQMFDLLDSDNDGFISSKNIKLSVLDIEILEALTPVLAEMQKNNVQLSFKDFCIQADKCLCMAIEI